VNKPHHGQRVEPLTSGERRAVGQQPGAFISGDKRQGHGQELLHETDDARMRFGAKRRTAETHPCISCGSTDAQAIASVEAQKRRSGIVGSRKDTDAIPRFCRNPQMRISVKHESGPFSHE
jgi:hypothetical protein